MKNDEIVDLLRAYIINFPILKDWGMMEPLCITLVFNNSRDSMKFLKNLSRNPVVISESEGVPSMKKAILRKTPQSVFLRMSHCETEKELGKLSILFAVSSGEKIGDKKICCPTFVIYVGIVPDVIRRDTLVVNISSDELNYDNSSDFFSFVPDAEQLGQVKQKIIDLGSVAENEILLISAACFLYPKLHERGENARFEEILTLARLIANGDMETPPIDDVVTLVTDLLLELAEKGCMDNAIELPNLEDSAVKALDATFFYDEEFLYISDSHFREICNPLLEVVSYRDIKFTLREAGIIQGTGSRNVSKMYYWRTYGIRSSATMLKFNMELIQKDDVKLKFYF